MAQGRDTHAASPNAAKAYPPGLRCLAERANLVLGAGVTSETIAFDLAPRINGPGRLASPSLALELLLATDPHVARELAGSLEAVRTERRLIQQRILDEALAEIADCSFDRDPAIVIGRQGWHSGVVGIVAANVVERTGKPAVVISFDGDVGRGSVRAPEGTPIYDLLQASKEALTIFGGHQAAAGLELRASELTRFRELFCAAMLTHQSASGGPAPVSEVDDAADVLMDPRDAPYDVVRNFDLLEPCGMGNPQPRVGLSRARVARVQPVRGGHLQVQLALDGGHTLYGFGQMMGARAGEFPMGSRVDAVGGLRRDSYRGGDAVGFRVESIQPSST